MSTRDKITSEINCILLYALILPLFIGCSQPTEFDSQLDLRTPELVVDNLTFAYRERNLERYMNSFSDQSLFLDGARELWGYETEKQIHEKLFARAAEIDLKMRALGDPLVRGGSVQAAYAYRVSLQWTDESATTAQGEVLFEFKKEGDNWRIDSFIDQSGRLTKLAGAESGTASSNDSTDYLPLRVGNTWLYKNALIPTLPEVRTTVTGSQIIRGNQYYCIENFLYISPGSLHRLDSLRLKSFIQKDSVDLVVLDFNANFGDSLVYTPPHLQHPLIVELIGEKDSVTVPAGTFFNVKEFQITDFNSGSGFLYEFAAGVGLIRQKGTNTINELISAEVNGKIVTGIRESPPMTWTELKTRVLQILNTR